MVSARGPPGRSRWPSPFSHPHRPRRTRSAGAGFFPGGAMLPIHLAVRLARRLHAGWAAHARPASDADRTWRVLDVRLTETRRARHRVRLAASANLTLTLP